MLTAESAFSAWTSQNLVELAERNNAVNKGNASTLLVTIGMARVIYTLQLYVTLSKREYSSITNKCQCKCSESFLQLFVSLFYTT